MWSWLLKAIYCLEGGYTQQCGCVPVVAIGVAVGLAENGMEGWGGHVDAQG